MKTLFNLDETIRTLGIPPETLVDLIRRDLVPLPLLVDGFPFWNGAGLRAWVRSLDVATPAQAVAVVLAGIVGNDKEQDS